MIIEPIADYACETGEGPLWHPDEGRLYWVDIPPGKLYRYDPATGAHGLVLDAGEAIGGFTIQGRRRAAPLHGPRPHRPLARWPAA